MRLPGPVLLAFARCQAGVAGIDYGLLLGLVALAIVAAVGLLGQTVEAMFTVVQSEFGASMPSGG